MGEKIRATLKIRGLREKEATVVVRALKPDDIGLPDGCRIRHEVGEGETSCIIVGRMEMGSLLSTLNDLMLSYRAAEGSLKAIKDNLRCSSSLQNSLKK